MEAIAKRNGQSASFDQGVWQQKSSSGRLRQRGVAHHANDVGANPEEGDKRMKWDKKPESNFDCDAVVTAFSLSVSNEFLGLFFLWKKPTGGSFDEAGRLFSSSDQSLVAIRQ